MSEARISPVELSCRKKSDKKDTNKVVYAILGHGVEYASGFDYRKECPYNVTLVTFTRSGNPLYSSHDGSVEFNHNYSQETYDKVGCMLRNPGKYRKQLTAYARIPTLYSESKSKKYKQNYEVRVYRPGDKIPNLNNTLLLNFPVVNTATQTNTQNQNIVIPSGVVKIPQKKFDQVHRNDTTPEQVYRDNVYEKEDLYHNFNNITSVQRKYNVYNILATLSEKNPDKHVIVYYPVCRAVDDEFISNIEGIYYTMDWIIFNSSENVDIQKAVKFIQNFINKERKYTFRKDVTPDFVTNEYDRGYHMEDYFIESDGGFDAFAEFIGYFIAKYSNKSELDRLTPDEKKFAQLVISKISKSMIVDAKEISTAFREGRMQSEAQQEQIRARSMSRRKKNKSQRRLMKTRKSRYSREFSITTPR